MAAEARLATWRLVPTLEIQPVAPPAAAIASSSPLIAICMATFDPPLELFQRQIESIRAQTHDNWVCVISDDSSRPERLAAMREILRRRRALRARAVRGRRGFYGNFERALALAPPEAEYLALADQDDRWHPDKLEVLLGAARGRRVARLQRHAGGGRERACPVGHLLALPRQQLHGLHIARDHQRDHGRRVALPARARSSGASRSRLPHGDIFHDHWLALVAMATGEIRYVDRPLYDYVQHSAAALGFSKANAGRGRWGGWLADVTLRMLRLASRVVRPAGQARYFENYCRLVLEARALEQRLGDALSPADRGALRRIQECNGSVGGAAWFAWRTLRPLFGRNETMGMERGLLAGLLWRLLAGLRAQVARVRSSA